MTIDPNDYDVNELRGMPGTAGGNQSSGSGPESVRPDDALRSGQYRELFRLQTAATDANLEKPYLERMPQSFAAEATVFEWLEFLVSKAGFKGTLDALRLYRSLEWLNEEVEEDLRDYVTGFNEPGTEPSDLNRSDHTLSLVYIARLASMQ